MGKYFKRILRKIDIINLILRTVENNRKYFTH